MIVGVLITREWKLGLPSHALHGYCYHIPLDHQLGASIYSHVSSTLQHRTVPASIRTSVAHSNIECIHANTHNIKTNCPTTPPRCFRLAIQQHHVPRRPHADNPNLTLNLKRSPVKWPPKLWPQELLLKCGCLWFINRAS